MPRECQGSPTSALVQDSGLCRPLRGAERCPLECQAARGWTPCRIQNAKTPISRTSAGCKQRECISGPRLPTRDPRRLPLLFLPCNSPFLSCHVSFTHRLLSSSDETVGCDISVIFITSHLLTSDQDQNGYVNENLNPFSC